MADGSRQFVRARISRAKFRHLLKLFALDLTATRITASAGLKRNTANRYLRLVRQAMTEHCQRESPLSGEVELDESYFGARRVRGKRGRGARGKTSAFGIYKRNGRVYTEVVPDCTKAQRLSGHVFREGQGNHNLCPSFFRRSLSLEPLPFFLLLK